MKKYSYKFNSTISASLLCDAIGVALDVLPKTRSEKMALCVLRELCFRLSTSNDKAVFNGNKSLTFNFTYVEAQAVLMAWEMGWIYSKETYALAMLNNVTAYLDQQTV